MNIELNNKKVWVGGSTQGLGRAIAMQLAASGADVTLVSRNEQKLKETLAQLPNNSRQKHQYLIADFGNYAEFENIVTDFFSKNTIDILVNNTQGPAAGGVLDKNMDDYQDAFNLLFKNIVKTSMLAVEAMKKQGFGRIINVSSISVKEPLANLVLSNTMRTALLSWSKTLATALAPNGITVNSILTGYFETERMTNIIEAQGQIAGSASEVKQRFFKDIPMGRFGVPNEYGYLVTFLASDQAGFITGADIPIDGGYLRGL